MKLGAGHNHLVNFLRHTWFVAIADYHEFLWGSVHYTCLEVDGEVFIILVWK